MKDGDEVWICLYANQCSLRQDALSNVTTHNTETASQLNHVQVFGKVLPYKGQLVVFIEAKEETCLGRGFYSMIGRVNYACTVPYEVSGD